MAGIVLNLDTLKFEDAKPDEKGKSVMNKEPVKPKIATKTAIKQEAAPAVPAIKKRVMPKATGYKGHKEGSRKEQIHKIYDEKGAEEAISKGVDLGVQAVTVKLWIREFKKSVTK